MQLTEVPGPWPIRIVARDAANIASQPAPASVLERVLRRRFPHLDVILIPALAGRRRLFFSRGPVHYTHTHDASIFETADDLSRVILARAYCPT